MPYPFDAETVRDFADGLEELFVVEEKVTLSEIQVRNALYPLPDGRRPRVIGQKDEMGRVLLPGFPEVSPDDVARALAARIAHFHTSPTVDDRIAFIDAKALQARAREALSVRAPRTSARVAPTTLRPGCRREAVPRAGSGATSWPPTWTAATLPTPTWGGGRELDRAGPLRRDRARVPEPRRRHLLSLGAPRDPGLRRGGSTSPTRSSSTTRWR